jgi:branched-chain amino acid transport system permease protein
VGRRVHRVAAGHEFDILLLALVVVVVGGLGSVSGALLAALVVGLVDEFGKWLFPAYALFTLYAPVALLLAFRPRGFFGTEEAA